MEYNKLIITSLLNIFKEQIRYKVSTLHNWHMPVFVEVEAKNGTSTVLNVVEAFRVIGEEEFYWGQELVHPLHVCWVLVVFVRYVTLADHQLMICIDNCKFLAADLQDVNKLIRVSIFSEGAWLLFSFEPFFVSLFCPFILTCQVMTFIIIFSSHSFRLRLSFVAVRGCLIVF